MEQSECDASVQDFNVFTSDIKLDIKLDPIFNFRNTQNFEICLLFTGNCQVQILNVAN